MKDHQAGHTTFCDENYRTWNISFQPLNYEEKSGVISKHEKVVQAADYAIHEDLEDNYNKTVINKTTLRTYVTTTTNSRQPKDKNKKKVSKKNRLERSRIWKLQTCSERNDQQPNM